MRITVVTVAFAMAASPASAIETYECEPLRGKSARIDGGPPEWVDDFYGTSTVIIEGHRFLIAAGSAVPDNIRAVVGDERTIYDLVVMSRDQDHLIGAARHAGGVNVFQFHRPTKTLVNVATKIDNFAYPDADFRNGTALAFTAQCR
jgi:hypothetical protein